MSLDVHLISKEPITKRGTGIFVRDNGSTRELSIEEAREKYPNAVIEEQAYTTNRLYHGNVTHNLSKMALAAGIYSELWRPEENSITHACQLIEPLTEGLKKLESHPEDFKKLNPSNGWGDYEGFVAFVKEYLAKCKEFPNTEVKTDG